jgi:predicted ATPase/DNA-binding SARP family transcriptional activator
VISVALLGPVEVRRDGELLAVPSGKPTELLMRLAVAAGTMVPKEQLLEDLWAADAVSTTANTMQSKVSRLRRALGDPALVEGGQIGYKLAVDPGAVDVHELARRADTVTTLVNAGDSAGVRNACTEALRLFRGDSLFGASDADWLRPHRAQAEGLRLRLIEDQLRARLDLGASSDVVDELQELVVEHPLREGLWGLLITALYRAGRQADALAAYRSVREHLVEELGLEPGRDLKRLEHQVLAQDPALDAPAPKTSPEPPLAPPRVDSGNLPAISSSLVGRDRECADLAELCDAHRLVTLAGSAGVGKTRLALEVARQLQPGDGAWFVRLETARTPESVGDTIAVALHASDASEAALIERLRGADVLIVLDNCEHVVDAVAELVDPLLRAGAGVRLLTTSQLPLRVDGEHVYVLSPLPFADAVELFGQRAAVHDQAVAATENTATIEELCRSLDGLPLAIELAAARTRSLSLAEISRRLEDRFSVLRDPASRRPERQRTLAAAIGWSYDLLFPDDQRGLWALAAFVGGAPLDGIERVLGALGVPDEAAVDVVDRLVDRSLVTIEKMADGGRRYWLLDSVRTFALDRLDESGDAQVAFGAHAAWVAGGASAAAEGARGPDQLRHVAWARSERANIDAALEWAGTHDPLLALTIANQLGWVWMLAGDHVAAERMRAALHAAESVASDQMRLSGSLLLGWLHAAGGDVELGHSTVVDAIAQFDFTGDDVARAQAEFFLAYVLSQKGDFEECQRVLDRSRPVFVESGQSWDEAANWVLFAHVTLAAGDQAAATKACTEATRLLADVQDPWFLVHTEAMLGAVAQAEARFVDACGHLRRAADAAQAQGFASTEAYHRANLGRAQQQEGDLDAAATSLQAAIDIARATGDLRVASLARMRLGRVLREQGDPEAARTQFLAAQAWYRASGGGDHALLTDCLVAVTEPSAPDANVLLVTVLAEARRTGDFEVEVHALDALARRGADDGDLSAAAAWLELADTAMNAARLRVTEADRIDAHETRRLIP